MGIVHTLGGRVRKLRTCEGITRDELCVELSKAGHDVTKATLGNLENDKNRPTVDLVIALSEYFKVSTDWILMGKDSSFDYSTGLCLELENTIARLVDFKNILENREK